MNKAILFFVMLFAIPFMFQEVYGEILELKTGAAGFTADGIRDFYITDTGNNFVCDFAQTISRTLSTIISFGTYEHSLTNFDCVRAYIEMDISSIPDNAHVSRITIQSDVFSLFEDETCEIRNPNIRHTATNADIVAAIASGTLYFKSQTNDCMATIPNQPFWGGAATVFLIDSDQGHFNNNDIIADIETAVASGQDWFSLGWKTTVEVPHPTLRKIDHWGSGPTCTPTPTFCLLIHIYWEIIPEPVDTLFVTDFFLGGVSLEWEAPELNNGTFSGYQINLTTPHGDPLTPVVNDTMSTAITADVVNLNSATNYTFRVSAVTDDGSGNGGINASGFLLNLTTTSLGNFTVGFFDLDADNFDARDIKYRRLDEPNDVTVLEVVYPQAFNLTCTFDYRFQNTNQTFTNLVTVPESFDSGGLPSVIEQKATFTFVNASKEVIRVVCGDASQNVTAPFLLTVTQFPLINQLLDFRAGDFGTDGNLGALDIITLGVVVMVMIGFNRWNESVGAIFAVGMLGALSFFQIVEWQTFMFGTFAVVIMVIVASTRKP